MDTTNNAAVASQYIGEADFQQRFDAQEHLARMVGMRLPETRVPAGEALWDIGEEAKQKLDSTIEALPSFIDGARMLRERERIKAEDARDYRSTPVQRINMSVADGRPVLSANTTGPLGYTKVGLSHVIDVIKPAGLQSLGANLLAISDPMLRASVFNHHATKAADRNAKPTTLRTIVEPKSGLRVLRAVVSDIHSASTGDDAAIVAAMESQLGGSLASAKMRVTRDLEKTHLEALWPAMKRQTKVGDVVLIGVRVRNSETKQGGLRIEPFVLDTLCYNFTTAESKGGEEEIVIRHVGDVGPKLASAFMRALKKVDPFIKAFGDSYKTELPATRGEMLQRVARVFELPASTVEIASKAWDEQAALHSTNGDTLADLVNAMTKASQAESMDAAMVTGRAAGTLIERGLAAIEN
jgi:hypothetical protein